MAEFDCYRPSSLSENIVIIDGYSASGKSLVSLYLQTYSRVQKMGHNQIFTDLASTYYLRKIEKDAVIELLNIYADTMLTGSMLSRDINFRVFDDSSVFKTPKKFEYFKRAFRPDGDAVLKYVDKEKPILRLVTHFSSIPKKIFFEAFKNRLTFISVVRHPMYMFDWWVRNFKMYGNNKRGTGFLIQTKSGGVMPSYALGLMNEYDSMTIDERVVFTMDWLNKESVKINQNLSQEEKDNQVEIVYEHFVKDPYKYEQKLQKQLNDTSTNSTKKFLKKQGLPARNFSGRQYKRSIFGFKSGEEKDDYEAHKNFINRFRKNCSPNVFDKLMEMSIEYEERHNIDGISTSDYI